MSAQRWAETVISAQIDGTALANTTTGASIIPAAAQWTMPANHLEIGKTWRIFASGRVSTAASSPGTLTFEVRVGAVIVATFTTATLQTSQTNVTWRIVWELTCRAIGASTSTTFMHTAMLHSLAFAASPGIVIAPATAPAVGTGFDSTTAAKVDFQADWSVANASNTITLHQYYLEVLN